MLVNPKSGLPLIGGREKGKKELFNCPKRRIAKVAGVSIRTVERWTKELDLVEDLVSVIRFVLKHRLKCPATIGDVDELVDSWGVGEEHRPNKKSWGEKAAKLRRRKRLLQRESS